MRCPNCDHQNPKEIQVCENCNANFEKTSRSNLRRIRRGVLGSFFALATRFFSSLIIITLILLTIASVGVFNCIFEVPEAPEDGYPLAIITIWESVSNMQLEKCEEIGFAGSGNP